MKRQFFVTMQVHADAGGKTFEREYKGLKEVYSVNLEYILADDIDTVIGEQKIYLIQVDKDSWKIIDLTPFQHREMTEILHLFIYWRSRKFLKNS